MASRLCRGIQYPIARDVVRSRFHSSKEMGEGSDRKSINSLSKLTIET